jgi:hypothetical protein
MPSRWRVREMRRIGRRGGWTGFFRIVGSVSVSVLRLVHSVLWVAAADRLQRLAVGEFQSCIAVLGG